VAIHDGLVIAPELSGFVHCLDAETGERYWTHDVLDSILSSPLIVDGKVYVGDEDGEVCIFELSKEKKVLGERIMPNFVYSSPVFANGVLYIAAQNQLYAIQGEEGGISAARGKSSRRDLAPRAVFTPTPHDVVEAMLRLANVGKDDLVCDLGSGDGRIVVAAAKRFGCKAVGYEIDGKLVELSRENAKRQNVEELVTIERRNLFDVDLSEIDVVTLYLLPSQNRAMLPQLEKLKPGSRIVAHEFGIEGLEPDKVLKVVSKEDGAEHTLFLWTTPLRKKTGGETK
jgi:precorrin-6B methylase 2